MNNENQDQKNALTLALKASETELVSQKNELRKHLNVKILNVLLRRWRASLNDEFRTEMFQIFSDIKDQEALSCIMDSLEAENRIDRKNEIISLLWMSSLDASDHLVDLVNIALNGNYMTVVEVSTVIESFEGEFGEDEVMESMYQIDEKLLAVENPEFATVLMDLKEVVNKLNVT
ncbi:MAG TPA: hypothetical protein DCX54_05910 [Flavobacteriales bacterium]|nr:hypothetical protein [Flavobacteriales bacterium]